MKAEYSSPQTRFYWLTVENSILVASGGQVPNPNFEGDWDTGEELDF